MVGTEHSGQAEVDSAGNIEVTSQFFGANGDDAQITSTASWTEAFNFAAGDTATFDFFIPGGVIAFEANNVSGLVGSFGVAVLLNGNDIFSTFTEVTTSVGTPTQESDLAVSESGTTLTRTFATGPAAGFGLTGAGFSFGPYTGSLDLATDAVVGTNTLLYVMQSEVSPFIGETSAIASIGDPLGLNTGSPPGSASLTSGPAIAAPAPAPLALLLIGLTLVLFVRSGASALIGPTTAATARSR